MAKKKRKKLVDLHVPRVDADPLHDGVVDDVCEADRDWFLAHPGVTERIRFPVEHELCQPSSWPACAPLATVPFEAYALGTRIVVRVARLGEGTRTRQFVVATSGTGWPVENDTLSLRGCRIAGVLASVVDIYDTAEATAQEQLASLRVEDVIPGDPVETDLPSEEYMALADEALEVGQPVAGVVEGQHLVAVPDVVLAEAIANGEDVPATRLISRADGRTVSFFSDTR